MGLINDFKKILFGAKSVVKSGADKASEFGKEKGKEIMDDAKKGMEKAKEKAEEVGEKVLDTFEEVSDEIMDKAEKFWEKTKETADDVGEKVIQKTSEYTEKGKEWVKKNILEEDEDTPSQTDSSDSSPDMNKNTTEKEKTADPEQEASSIVENAFETIDSSSIEEEVEKASNLADELEKEAKNTSKGHADSTLSEHNSFFERAQRFADGDYHNTGAKDAETKEGEIKIIDDQPKQMREKKGQVPGFTDHDGDGNEVIDDAIIDDKE